MAHSIVRHLVSLVILTLLSAPGAAQEETRPPDDDPPLVVEVLDRHHPRNRERLQPGRPPVVFEGNQIQSMDQLRVRLRLRSDRDENPDSSVREIAPGVRPSRRGLVLRCDGTQLFGWVQAILQICTFVPGRSREEELEKSPLIYRVAIEATGTGRRLKTWLPVDQGLTEVPRRQVEVILKLPKSAWDKPAHEREVLFMMAGSNAPLGRSRGLAFHSEKPEDLSLLLDPPDTLLRVRRYLAEVRQIHPEATAKLNVYARTPIVYAFEIVEAMQEAGYKKIVYSGIPGFLMRDLENGRMNTPHGLASLLDGIRVTVPDVAIGGGRRDLRPRGGGSRTQRAVESGLAWLAVHQSPDGSWDGDGFAGNCEHGQGARCDGPGHPAYDVGVTGLSLLAFLAAGHTHREGTHKTTVRRGLRWLKSRQDAEGCFGGRDDPHFGYNHAIAALAMAEAYGMTRSGIWKASAQNGVNFIVKMQNPNKAWRYGVRPGDNDTSVTGWMVTALKSAKMGGLEVSPSSIGWAHGFVKEMTDEQTGRTGYTRPGERPVRAEGRLERYPAEESESVTAVGMLVRIFAGEDPKSSAVLQAGANLLGKRPPRWEPDRGRVDMYYWYWGTLAMFQMGGAHWTSWNHAMKTAVVETQLEEGAAAGSWDPVGPWGAEGGRVYSTAVMTLCLEVYYRYSRMFRSK